MTTLSFRHPSRALAFRIAVFCTAIYHGIAYFLSTNREGRLWRCVAPRLPPAPTPGLGRNRRGSAGLLLRRPKWLLVPYIVMGVRLFNGHGRNIWRLWTQSGLVAWAEVGLLIGYIVIGVRKIGGFSN